MIIYNRWNPNEIVFQSLHETMRETVEAAIAGDADLTDANLTRADLTRADLTRANLTRADLTRANLTRANLTRANLTRADLTRANLTRADLTRADLTRADLTRADLTRANLTRANLRISKHDFWGVLLANLAEVPAFRAAMVAGQINGSSYTGECACLVGTIANIKHCNYNDLRPDSSSPAEKWFLAIKTGDTPENSQISAITVGWLDELIAIISPDKPLSA